jgi:hypothetical protein
VCRTCIACVESWADEDFEMLAVEGKGRDAEFTGEITGVCRAPTEDTRVIERLATPTDGSGKSPE